MARRLSEQPTRKEMIDPQLEKAGWYLNPRQKHINSKNNVNALRTLQSAAGDELLPALRFGDVGAVCVTAVHF